MTKIWPSVRTPSTSKIRILMFFARDSTVIRMMIPWRAEEEFAVQPAKILNVLLD